MLLAIRCFSLTLALSSCTLRAFGIYGHMDTWAWHVYVCMMHDACGCFVVCFCVSRSSFGALLRNILGFHTYAYVAGVVWDAWARNILVCHTIVSPRSVALSVWSFVVLVRWFFVLSLFLVLCLSLCFFFFF